MIDSLIHYLELTVNRLTWASFQANVSDIQANWSAFQANLSARYTQVSLNSTSIGFCLLR